MIPYGFLPRTVHRMGLEKLEELFPGRTSEVVWNCAAAEKSLEVGLSLSEYIETRATSKECSKSAMDSLEAFEGIAQQLKEYHEHQSRSAVA